MSQSTKILIELNVSLGIKYVPYVYNFLLNFSKYYFI